MLCAAAVYAQCWRFEFAILDDNIHIVQNPALHRLGVDDLASFWLTIAHREYVPLTYMWWSALTRLTGRTGDDAFPFRPNPGVFHLGNMILHASCGLVLLRILRRLTPHEGAACLGTLVFVLHPLQVGSVAWASEARGLLSVLFVLLAIDWYLGSCAELSSSRAASAGAALGCFVLALLAKPTAVCAPLLAAVAAAGWLGQRPRDAARRLLPWLVPLVAAIGVAKFAQPDASIDDPVNWGWRPVVALNCLAFYVEKFIWPTRLAPDYGLTPARILAQPGALIAWIPAVGGLAALAWVLRAGRIAALLFVAGLLPALGLISFFGQNFSAVADRYAYLAMLGPAAGCAALLDRSKSRWIWSAAMLVLAAWGNRRRHSGPPLAYAGDTVSSADCRQSAKLRGPYEPGADAARKVAMG